MAELAKKLYFLKNGTEQTAKAYSTVDEAGDNYVPLKIDGVACYAPIGVTNDAMATNGRVIKGGTTYAIKSQSKPPYAEISYTTAGTHTFTVPAGVTRLRVAVCGGGGGGCSATADYQHLYASSGGTSKFGSLIQATGGGGGWSEANVKSGEWYGRWQRAGSAGSPNGNKGGSSSSGGSGFALSFTKSSGSYGKGGDTKLDYNSAGAYSQGDKYAVGGSGGYDTNYFNVTPGTSYSVTVGKGGAKLHGGNSRYPAYDGNSGFVLIAYGGDI